MLKPILASSLLAALVFSGCLGSLPHGPYFEYVGHNEIWAVTSFEWEYNGTLIEVNLTIRNTSNATHPTPIHMGVGMRHQVILDPRNSSAAESLVQFGEHPSGDVDYMSNSMQIKRNDFDNSTSSMFITPAAVWHRDQVYTNHDYFFWSEDIEAGGERTLHLLFNRLDNFSASNNWNSVSIGIQDQVNGERSYTFWGGPCFGDHHPGFYARLNETLVCRWLDSEGRWYPEHVGT